MKNNILRRLLITVITGAVLATSVPQVALAAPVPGVEARNVDNEQIAQNALEVLEEAIASNDVSKMAEAYKLITSLTPTQRVHLFLLKFGKLYLEGYLNGSFKYFNVEKYLAENPDVYSLAIASGENPAEYAIKHYVSAGIFEGRSSCTDFDPIVAILACPDAVVNALISNDDSSMKIFSDINAAFTNATGDEDTKDYSIDALFLYDDNVKQVVDNSKKNRLSVSKVIAVPQGETEEKTSNGNDDGNSGSHSSSSGSDTPAPTPTPDPPIDPEDPDDPEPIIVPRSQTLMLYMCGSDLETANNPAGSKCLRSLLSAKYDSETTKVLIMAGGAKEWYSEPFKSDLGGSNAGKVCIYELDISSLEDLLINSSTDLNLIVNSDTVKKVATCNGTPSMGDASTLTSFVNYVTGKSDYAAEDYDLILWSHGGGFMGGICPDANDSMNPLDCNELLDAIANTNYCKAGNKLAFLGLDACLMGEYENAVSLSPYYEYMVGTAEIEQGGWDYTRFLNVLNKYASGEYSAAFGEDELKDQKAKQQMLADVMKDLAQTHGSVTEGYMPYSCYDGAKLDPTSPTSLAYHIDNIAKCVNDALGEKDARDVKFYRALMSARALSRTYGDEVTRHTEFDYTDLGELIFNIKNQVSLLATGANPEKYTKYQAVIAAIDGFDECLKENGSFIDYSSCIISNKTIYGGLGADMQYYTYDSIDADRYNDRENADNPYFVAFWREMGFDTDFLGTSIYFPHNSSRSLADIKNKYGSVSDKTTSKTGLSGYRALIETVTSMYNEKLNSKITGEKYDEQDRIKFLQGYIYNAEKGTYEKSADINSNAKILFNAIYDTSAAQIKETSDGVQYIHVPVKEEYINSLTYSSMNAAVDLSDTIGKVTVYTMRHLNVTDNAEQNIYNGDIIYCAGDEKLSSVNRADGSLNIILATKDADDKPVVSNLSLMKTQYYYGAEGTYANDTTKTVRDVAVGKKTISYNNPEEQTIFKKLASTFIGGAEETLREVGTLFYFAGRVVTTAARAVYESNPEYGLSYRDANIYFKKTGVDEYGFDLLEFVGTSDYDLQNYAKSASSNDISSFQFYHYAIDKTSGTMYTIEKGIKEGDEVKVEPVNLGFDFLVSDGSESYQVTITEKPMNYADGLADNKYAIGLEDEADITYGGQNEGKDEWIDDNGNPIDRFLIAGEGLTYDSTEYGETNTDIGVFDSSSGSSSNDGTGGNKPDSPNDMVAQGDAATEDIIPVDDNIPNEIESVVSSGIKVPGVLTPGQVTQPIVTENSAELPTLPEEVISEIPAQPINVGDYLVPETTIPSTDTGAENNTPPTPDSDCGNDSSGVDDSGSSDTGSSDSGSDDGDSSSDSDSSSDEA